MKKYFPFLKRMFWGEENISSWDSPIDIGNLHILLIDDDEDDYIIIEDMLHDITQEKLALDWVSNYEEAIDVINSQQHDVCLLDYYLGKHTGLDVLHQALSNGYEAPIIMLTGLGDHRVDVKAMEAGAADYLIKGELNPYLLERSIRYAVQNRRILEALREREDRFRSLVQNSSDIISVLAADGTIKYISNSCERVLGYEQMELVGKNALEFIHPQDLPETQETFEQLSAEDDATLSAEFRFLHDNGSWRVLETTGSNHLNHPSIKGIVANARDVTEQRLAEKKAERYAADLERSNRELEQFGYVISHDLREPLRMVSSFLRLLEQRYGDQLDAKGKEFIDYAVDGAERMQDMIRALLNLSRVETRGEPLAPVDCEVVLKRTLNALQRTIKENEAEITHDPLPTVMADQAQLGQIFQNLIANAIKFRKEDEAPRVHISASPTPQPTSRTGEREWVFSVEDNGIGLDPNQANRIFQVFQRLHTEEEYPGLGLGLALCKRIVERHGGRIWVESEPGAGSTFYFTLEAKRDGLPVDRSPDHGCG
jgi:PAS domain S-box-containing protein